MSMALSSIPPDLESERNSSLFLRVIPVVGESTVFGEMGGGDGGMG